MGAAMELLTGRATAPGTTLTALTMSSGDSLTVRNSVLDSPTLLLQAWADVQATGTLRIRSPNLHDNVQGLRFGLVASEVDPLISFGMPQRLLPQDTLIVEIAGSAVAGQIEQAALLLYYTNLPGVDARFTTPDDVMKRKKNIVTVENTITFGVLGGYSTSVALNATFDLLKANVDYALLGYVCTVECCAIAWRGADTGNMRVSGPGNETDRQMTQNWFVRNSQHYNLPLIPVFNSANRAGILLDAIQDQAGTATVVSSIFAELMPASAAPAR